MTRIVRSGALALDVQTEGQNPVIRVVQVLKNLLKPPEFLAHPFRSKKFIDRDANRSPSGVFAPFITSLLF